MNLVDDLGNDLAIAFLVEKKYSKKMNPDESKALIGRIKEALYGHPSTENEKNKSRAEIGIAAPRDN
jgi:hypothetical protein